MMTRALTRGAILLASWILVQVPAKDMRLTNPGSNMPPITQFKRVREFDSATECETFRDRFLKDSASMGSDAMLDQASSLRCVSSDQLPAPGSGATPKR
jgi:hypothetical protein